MKLRIISDGTHQGTRVEDEDGRVLENVKEVGWFCDERGVIAARIILDRVEVDASLNDAAKVVVDSDTLKIVEAAREFLKSLSDVPLPAPATKAEKKLKDTLAD